MWRGQAAAALRESVYGALYFSVFDALRSSLGPEPSFGGLLVAGGATGATVWTAMFPLDVVKSIIQSNPALVGPSWLQVVREHYRNEGGLRGFYKGWSAAMVRSLPAHAVVLATYSKLMGLLMAIDA